MPRSRITTFQRILRHPSAAGLPHARTAHPRARQEKRVGHASDVMMRCAVVGGERGLRVCKVDAVSTASFFWLASFGHFLGLVIILEIELEFSASALGGKKLEKSDSTAARRSIVRSASGVCGWLNFYTGDSR